MGVIRPRGLIDLRTQAVRQPGGKSDLAGRENIHWRLGRPRHATKHYPLYASDCRMRECFKSTGKANKCKLPPNLLTRNALAQLPSHTLAHTQSDDRINDGVGLCYSTSSLQTLLIDLWLMLTLALEHHYKHLQCPCLRIMYGWVTLISIFHLLCLKEQSEIWPSVSRLIKGAGLNAECKDSPVPRVGNVSWFTTLWESLSPLNRWVNTLFCKLAQARSF